MKTYDLRLPSWGPYNKKYLGAAHVADAARGYRFDLNLFPGYYRRSVMNPRDVADCGAKIMAASRDLSHFVYRYELEWKDRVYVEADFASNGKTMTVTCDFVNETDNPESLTLNAVMSMQRCTSFKKELLDLAAVTGADTVFVDAVDYTDVSVHQKVAMSGFLLGENRASGFVGGSFLSSAFFGREGDFASYEVTARTVEEIGVRYSGGGAFALQSAHGVYEFELPFSKTPTLVYLPLDRQEISAFSILGRGSKIDFDGFVFGREISFDDGLSILNPAVETAQGGLVLRFGAMEYRVEADFDNYIVRSLYTDDVGVLLSEFIHNHVSFRLGEGEHLNVDLFLRPVFVEAHGRRRVVLKITAPHAEEGEWDNTLYRVLPNAEGAPYAFSQNVMSATTLTNVVFPIYSRRSFIRHNTPGRNWDCLYTWDSGFIGMGLSEMDARRGEDCLNAYLTPAGDRHSPYIFTGTPLPTQIFLFAELYQKTGDVSLISKYYDMVRQQYRFFADARKNGRAKDTGLFSTWDIFYNSGGWDDYSPQQYIHAHKMESTVCPMVNVSMTVLCARILKGLAVRIGKETAEYDEDIAFYSEAVNRYGWDEESGYYGYVNEGEVLKVDGVNADMGMDGVFPYVALIAPPEREARMVENMRAGMFTPVGVSVVDRRAPYYRADGYWNGSVWMPHQWILYKSFLDHGEADDALYIADTALSVWKREVDTTYNCYEHFMIENGRGAGFHQFSGLSTPILMWYSALYRPYTVTSGFCTLIEEKKREDGAFSFKVSSTAPSPTVLVCLEEGKKYSFSTAAAVSQVKKGMYCLTYSAPVTETVVVTEA